MTVRAAASRVRLAHVLALAVLVSACTAGPSRSPRLANPPQQDTQRVIVPIPGTNRASVRPGDTVYAVARRYGVQVRDLILANRLQPPYTLSIDQDLVLPAPRRYTVVPGDTIFSISQRFDVDMRTVVEMNRIQPPYQINSGQVLTLPSPEGEATTGAGGGRSIVAVAPAQVPVPRPRPDRGGQRPASSAAVPAAALPPAARAEAAPVGVAPDPVPVEAPVAAETAQPVPPMGEASPAPVDAAAAAVPVPEPRPVATAASILAPPPRGASQFMWPVRGRVVANFGPREGGLHNDGLNIAAPRGSPVLAADNGVIAYAGDGLPGFGNLILVKHADGWTTAYAHVDRVLAKRGETVRRGQAIATVGSTGNVDRPQLHFEIRRGARAVDPRPELERGA